MSSVDHSAAMLARLAGFLKGKTNLQGLLESVGTNYNALQTALDEVLSERSLETASGAQLDQIGSIIGEIRDGQSDGDYLDFLKARIQLNTASGTLEDIITIVHRIIRPSATYTIEVEELTAEVQVRYSTSDALTGVTNPALIGRFLQEAKAAGVRMSFIANPSLFAGQFIMTDTDQVQIGGPGLTDSTDGIPAGGTLSGVY